MTKRNIFTVFILVLAIFAGSIGDANAQKKKKEKTYCEIHPVRCAIGTF